MASLTPWTWVWVNSGSWWWTGRPSVLQSMRSQSQIWLSNWTELSFYFLSMYLSTYQSSIYISINCLSTYLLSFYLSTYLPINHVLIIYHLSNYWLSIYLSPLVINCFPSSFMHAPLIVFSFLNQKALSLPHLLPPSLDYHLSHQFSSVQTLSRVRLFVTKWITAHQPSLSITNS